MGALIIIPRTPISLGATAGDDDPVRERAEAGIQASKDLLHRGGIIDSLHPHCYPTPILSMRRLCTVSTSPDRFGHEEGNQATEVLRSGRRVAFAFHAATCLCLPSGFLAGQEQETQGEDSVSGGRTKEGSSAIREALYDSIRSAIYCTVRK
jgi:hypothetical protein